MLVVGGGWAGALVSKHNPSLIISVCKEGWLVRAGPALTEESLRVVPSPLTMSQIMVGTPGSRTQ